MENLVLRCNLQRCNIDGSTDMTLEKCVLNNNTPCYYLIVRKGSEDRPEDVWKKFDYFVTKNTKGSKKA